MHLSCQPRPRFGEKEYEAQFVRQLVRQSIISFAALRIRPAGASEWTKISKRGASS
jgi:hypothetical protein